MRDARERLLDIVRAIEAIERYAPGDRARFEQDELLQTWFLWHLQIIGEAARSLPDEVRLLNTAIPWSKIIGMRNVLAHGYFEIDTEIVWNAATRDALALKPAVEQLIRALWKEEEA